MLNKVKAAIAAVNKRVVVLVMALMLAATSINGFAYRDSVQVNIFVDGIIAKTFCTESTTVENVLEQGEFALAEGDTVYPGENIVLSENSSVNIVTSKKVNVYDGETAYNVETQAITTEELTRELDHLLGQGDIVVEAETGKAGNVVDCGNYTVKKAYGVNVYADFATYPVMIAEGTVADAIALAGVTVNEDDIVTPYMESELYEGVEIKIVRVTKNYETQTMAIPFDVEYRINKSLKPGQEVVVNEGSDGEMTISNTITFHDGVAVAYDSEEALVNPAVNKVVECGVWNVKRNDQNAAPAVGSVDGYSYSKVIQAKATAYCDKGKTASGIQSKVGVVAVDPKVIPLGTRLYIEATDGSWSYGVCLAGDTGGLIKGNRVDLFYDSYNECIQFGRRSCNIYVLSD